MPLLYAEAQIDAPRDVVWRSLLRKHEWFRWNTFLYDLSPQRPFQQGRAVLLAVKRVAGTEETEIEPLVTLLQPDVCLRWRYTAPGLRSEHRFELQDIGGNRTLYRHCETLSGGLTRLFLPFIRKDEQQGLQRMARELKRYAEQQR